MTPALLVFCYALAVAWFLPPLLTRLTRYGIGPRLGLTAWVTAMGSVLASAALALQFLIRAAVAGWPRLSEVVCRSVAGGACTPVVYRSALFEAALGAAAVTAALTAAALAWSYGRRTQRARRRTRAHAAAARITGRQLPGTGAVVLDAPRPAAYCVPGRPAAIVVTSAALAVLDAAQLGAVLAHERAHLAGRHHALITLTRGFAAAFPSVPLFTRGPAQVARLAEMRADDAAARRSGRRTLVAALLAIGTGTAVPAVSLPATALAATGGAVTARVQRLLEPPHRGRLTGYAAALAAVMLLLVVAAGLITAYAAR
ncbi:MAG: M56 family metallopeptidase [Streptosporangiaceae bacterium]|nr:M56 family metallopeptidase [Streptosporangiaceae bacterium]MBV9857531.1 M56 family metallopeptidase [Streptosporangiaceae bacterium]